ncbi:PAS domain S-box protein [Alicyclobacillus tolerans]|uniref:PAS domain S-box protein n=1 Tax=Alicyclobacillus tolerans TaxID=90970 RepID=UPI001F2D8EE7|nr:PAS domain S-box protein [Alicyclobacillus tolerans]MCF8566580.1 PAS domain S-box protein [Alicyclobacillus tolerans]
MNQRPNYVVRYQSILARLTDGFFALDLDWKFTYVNTVAKRLLAHFEGGLIGRTIWDEFPEAVKSNFYTYYHQAIEEQTPVEFEEYYAPLKTWFEVRAYPSSDGLSVFFWDITAKMKARATDEQRYRSLFDQNPNLVYSLDMEGRFTSANPAAEKVTGYRVNELLNMSYVPFVHPDDINATLERFRLAASGQPQTYNTAILDKSGKTIDLNVTNIPIVVDGEIVGVYGMATDITEQRHAEQALRESNHLLGKALQIAAMGVWEWEIPSGKVHLSNLALEMFEAYESEGTLEDFLELIHREDKQHVLQSIERALDGQPYEVQYRLAGPNGKSRVVKAQGEVVFDEKGQPQQMIGFVQDVTEAQMAQEQLRENQQRYRSLLEHNPDGVCSLDWDGHFLEANPAFEKISGYTRQELQNMSFADLLFDRDIERARAIHEQTLVYGELKQLEFQIRHKSGGEVHVRYTNVPIVVNGQVVGMYVILRDVTDLAQTEELLRKSEKLSAVGQLAAGVAHEIRNPLTALKGFVHLLREDPKPDYMDIMMQELNRIELISSEMLVLAKPQISSYQLRELNPLLESVIALMEAQANLKNVEIVADLDSCRPSVFCEETQLKQVCVNLMKNAIEAMPNGGVLNVRLKALRTHVQLEFQDHGPGMRPEQLSKLGEPFYTTKEGGTGLGLVVVYKIIENHQGTIDYLSTLGAGTTVRIALPIARPPAVADKTPGN